MNCIGVCESPESRTPTPMQFMFFQLISRAFMLLGAAIAVIAGIGVLRFSTPYARFHAAGKASPVAFLAVALGASLEVGWGGAAQLVVAAAAMVLTLPVGMHLLFRAVHRTTVGDHLHQDDLRPAEQAATDDHDDEERSP
ncbi:MAG: monovalent cation/H(+) antiporter subunit G, partial [Actinomycetota bacterium]